MGALQDFAESNAHIVVSVELQDFHLNPDLFLSPLL